MPSVRETIEAKYKKSKIVAVKSGDTVRVHQKIREGNKERIQIFEGLVIRTSRMNSLSATIAVRRIASGVGVEKTYLLHSPLVVKVEVTKRSKVRRNYLSYMRELTGKSARLSGVDFDRANVNAANAAADVEEEKIKEQQVEQHEAEAADKAEEKAKEDAKADAALKAHTEVKETKPENKA